MTKTIDLIALWEWEFDREFIRYLQQEAEKANLCFEHITTYDIEDFIRALQSGKIRFSTLLDRAIDTNESFAPVQEWAIANQVAVINPYAESLRTLNKSEMHYALMKVGVNVPFTVMLPSMEKMRWIDEALMKEVFKLPLPFVLKPAHGGGGEGVIKNVTSHHHVHDGRSVCYWDSYLAQECVYPKYLYGWRCWFRVYWNFGEVEIVWWDDTTRIYRLFSEKDKPRVRFDEIKSMMTRIAQVAKLHFFSTEIVLTRDDKLVAVDYINDQIDLRLKSKHYDGVPDEIVRKIARNIVRFAATQKAS
ncbi:MAG: RimK family alpha-L-glutamate ligase [Chloroherpetonaceae bacterium]